MTCPHCGHRFSVTDARRMENTVICPKCTAMIDTSVPIQKLPTPTGGNLRRNINPIAGALQNIAFITWGASIILTVLLFCFYDKMNLLTGLAVIYPSFVSGLLVYAFGEIILLLTEIRDNQKQ